MIQRAVTAIIGVVLGLFATFAVFSAILAGLDSFYLLTQDACNYGSENSPKRILRFAPQNEDRPGEADEIDWTADGLSFDDDGAGGCVASGPVDADATYLAPNGDVLRLGGVERQMVTVPADSSSDRAAAVVPDPASPDEPFSWELQNFEARDLWAGDGVVWVLHADGLMREYDAATGASTTNNIVLPDPIDDPVALWVGEVATGTRYYVVDDEDLIIYAVNSSGIIVSGENIPLDADNDDPTDIVFNPTVDELYVVENIAPPFEPRYARYNRSSGSALGFTLIPDVAQATGLWLYEATSTNWWFVFDSTNDQVEFFRVDEFGDTTQHDYTVSLPKDYPAHGFAMDDDFRMYFITDDDTVDVLSIPNIVETTEFQTVFVEGGSGYDWIPAENVFTAQRQLVTLLAVIAAIGMPVGAMTAIVFFGQAVISAGVSGQGASQVLVAIAAVVIILVAVQMFQQFAGYLGDAFDSVNGDRFVVFDETLGSLAETIAEFWGVLAFAGLINIATIVWRNYSGNFNIGGTQGGL